MNPSLPADELARERERDESYFLREYAAEFLDAASALLPTEMVENCVARGQTEFPPNTERLYTAALDAGFKSDSFAFALSSQDGDRVRLDLIREWKPRKGRPVQFTDVLNEIVAVMRLYNCPTIYGDKVASEPIRQVLLSQGITFTETTTLGRRASGIFQTVRAKVIAGQLVLPDNLELVNQFKRLEITVGAGGSERVEAASGHDDMAICASLAIHQAISRPSVKPWVDFIIADNLMECGSWKPLN
jgi:hypothetical protein